MHGCRELKVLGTGEEEATAPQLPCSRLRGTARGMCASQGEADRLAQSMVTELHTRRANKLRARDGARVSLLYCMVRSDRLSQVQDNGKQAAWQSPRIQTSSIYVLVMPSRRFSP